MKIQVTNADASICKRYVDLGGCLLATALKRHFKTEDVSAGAWVATIGTWSDPGSLKQFHFSISDSERIRKSYTPDGDRIRADFKPFTVKLILK